MQRFIIILTLLTLNAVSCPLSNNDNIQVTGVLKQKTFPGTPNYESIAKGDAAESFWFIITPHKVCFRPDGNFIKSEVKLSSIQLLTNGKNFNFNDGQRYKITGKTFPASSGHHHSKVMIVVSSVKKMD